MSDSDLWIRDVITSYGLSLLIFVFIGYLISQKWPNFQKHIYRIYLTGFEVECADLMIPYKKHLFKSLEHVISCDTVLRSMGCIRLLEIGVKTGLVSEAKGFRVHAHAQCISTTTRLTERQNILELGELVNSDSCSFTNSGENIQFYPDGTHLIGVDRNLRLAEYLMKGNRSWQFSHIIIEHLIVGDGSSLKEIPTGHVDVVVTTRSLCSMTSLKSTLREIHRVLAPGGRYLFIEHIPENEGTFIWWLQTMLSETRVWPSLYGGCQLNVHPVADIKNAGFNHITWDAFTLEGCVSQTFHLILSRQHILGVAVRSLN